MNILLYNYNPNKYFKYFFHLEIKKDFYKIFGFSRDFYELLQIYFN